MLEIDQAVVLLDLRYATANNITGRRIYDRAIALLHDDAHGAILRAAAMAQAQGLRLRVYDAYRPLAAQRRLWEALPDPNFVADPAVGSAHNRGIAVDLTLATTEGRDLDMGTEFDSMTAQSGHGRTDLSMEAQRNRALLLGIMTLAGWAYHPHEWWHYNLPDPMCYPIVDDPRVPVCPR